MPQVDGRLAGMYVLIVENEWLIADELRQVLAQQGAYVIGPAASVNRAFELIGGTLRIDAALLDIHLGQGPEVYPVAEMLRRLGVPFVFTTGYDEGSVRRDFAGTPHLMKPFLPSEIGPVLVAASSRSFPPP